MANSAINSLFSKKNKKTLAEGRKKAVKSLKAPDGRYYARIVKWGFKTTDKKDDDGDPIIRFFWAASILCDDKGNKDAQGEQAYTTIDVVATEKKTKAEVWARVVEAFDKLNYEMPAEDDPNAAENLDADVAAILNEKPLVTINISTPDGYDRKFANLSGLASVEDIEEALGHSIDDVDEVDGEDEEENGNDEPEADAGKGEGDEEPGGDDEPEDEPAPAKSAKSAPPKGEAKGSSSSRRTK